MSGKTLIAGLCENMVMQMILNFSFLRFAFPYPEGILQDTSDNESVCAYVFKNRNDILHIRSIFSRYLLHERRGFLIVPRYFEDLSVLHENTLPVRSYYVPTSGESDLPGDRPFRESSGRLRMLSGCSWLFRGRDGSAA